MDRVLVFREGELFARARSRASSPAARLVAELLRAGGAVTAASASASAREPARGVSRSALAVMLADRRQHRAPSPTSPRPSQVAADARHARPVRDRRDGEHARVPRGGGGIDLSIAPLMGFVNILLVTQAPRHRARRPGARDPDPARASAPSIGAINGVLVTRLRYPARDRDARHVFVLSGADLALVPNPVTALAATGPTRLAGSVGPVPGRDHHRRGAAAPVARAAPHAVRRVAAVRRRPRRDRFSAGMNVNAVRISAYALGGMIAGSRRDRAHRAGAVRRRAGVHQLHPGRARRGRARRHQPRRRARRPGRIGRRRRQHLPAREPPDRPARVGVLHPGRLRRRSLHRGAARSAGVQPTRRRHERADVDRPPRRADCAGAATTRAAIARAGARCATTPVLQVLVADRAVDRDRRRRSAASSR